MARPEDTLARGGARNAAGYDQGYDANGQSAPPRRPADPRAAQGISNPLPPESQRASGPGVTPRFDPYMPAAGGPARTQPQQEPRFRATDARQDLPPDPYSQPRAPMGGTSPQRQAPYAGQAPAPPASSDPRYAASLMGGASPERPATMGRPGQTQRSPAPGYAPAAAPQGYAPLNGNLPQRAAAQPGYDPVPATGRAAREPFFETPARQAPAGPRPTQGYAQDGYGEDPYADTASSEPDEGDYEVDEDDAAEPAPRSRRGLWVTGALVVAILIGGSAGYAYKLSAGRASGTPPLVKAEASPAKTLAVADASAQASAGAKKTILDRPNSDASAAADVTVVPSQEQVAVKMDGQPTDPAAQSGDSVAVPRKVATVVVKPGEKIAPKPVAAQTAVDESAAPPDSVPSITIGDVAAAPDKAVEAVKAKAKTAVKAVQAAATQAVVAPTDESTAEPAMQDPAADAAMAGTADPAAAAQKAAKPIKLGTIPAKAVTKKIVKAAPAPQVPAADATDPSAAEVATPPASAAKTKLASASPTPKASGSGYLIQVRSVKTQAEALAYFADLQQKYADVLGAGQPDIQEADIPGKGKMFRLRIGPPGSAGAAKELCTKLKASGLKDCITAAY